MSVTIFVLLPGNFTGESSMELICFRRVFRPFDGDHEHDETDGTIAMSGDKQSFRFRIRNHPHEDNALR